MSIPKIIHYCWFGGVPKPEIALKCINSWKKYCPDFEIREWNENNFDVSSSLFSSQAFEHKKWAFVSDYARLLILEKYGGIYLDTDVELIKPIDKFLNEKSFIGFEGKDYVANGLILGSESGNEFIRANKAVYDIIPFVNEDGSFNTRPCPQYTTDVLKTFGLSLPSDGTIQRLGLVTVYPTDYFGAVDYVTGELKKSKYTHSIHHYSALWQSEEERELHKKEQQYYRDVQRKERLKGKFGLKLGSLIYRIQNIFIDIKEKEK